MKYALFFIALLMPSCHGKYYSALNKMRIYDSGLKLSDGEMVKFGSSFASLQNDIILIRGVPRAKIISLKDGNNEMHIQSLNSDSVGLYYNAEKFEH